MTPGPASREMPAEPDGREGSPIVSDLSAGLAAIAGNAAGPEADDPPAGERPPVPPRAAPRVSEAALAIADELLSLDMAGGRAGGAQAPAAAAGPARLGLLVGGRRLEVPAAGVVLGRRPGPGGIVVSDSCVSRRHAQFRPTADGIAVADLGSTNGTVIIRGGTRIDARREGTPVAGGDRITTADGRHLAEVVGEPGAVRP